MGLKYKTPLQRKRLKLGLTQMDVAASVGISSRHYQQIETFKVKPGVVIGIRIAITLRSSVETLWRDCLE
jgi:DNA-binding XRE family transcriptional regulator